MVPHTENFFRNLIKSNRNQIVSTIFRLIWNTNGRVRLDPNQSENGNYNLISGWFNKISKRFLCVYAPEPMLVLMVETSPLKSRPAEALAKRPPKLSEIFTLAAAKSWAILSFWNQTNIGEKQKKIWKHDNLLKKYHWNYSNWQQPKAGPSCNFEIEIIIYQDWTKCTILKIIPRNSLHSASTQVMNLKKIKSIWWTK